MGQAKNRGTLAQRVAGARARLEAMKPAFIVCNQCKTEVTDISLLDSQHLPGIDAVFGGTCPNCESEALAVKGEQAAVARLIGAMGQAAGEMPKLGML